MNSVKYLEQVRETLARKHDGELAQVLGISRAAISHYTTGRRIMDDETCLAVALQLGIEPMQVLGAAFLDRAEKSGQKSLWEVFMSRTAATAATVLIASGVNVFLTPIPANAATMRVSQGPVSTSYRLCAVERRRRRRDLSAVFTWAKRMLNPAALEPATS